MRILHCVKLHCVRTYCIGNFFVSVCFQSSCNMFGSLRKIRSRRALLDFSDLKISFTIFWYICICTPVISTSELSQNIINLLHWDNLNLSLDFEDKVELFFNQNYLGSRKVQTDLEETLKNSISNCYSSG